MRQALSNLTPFDIGARAKSDWHSPFAGWLVTAFALLLFSLPMFVTGQAPGVTAKDAKAAPPDVIVFANGDELTGKFLRSVGGNAVFHSDLAGDVTVSWDKVKEIRTASKFVVLQKGFQKKRNALPAHLPMGSLTVENDEIQLTASDGVRAAPIPLSNVDYIIDQPTFDRALGRQPGFFSDWTGSATGGATIVKATQNTFTFNGSLALVRVAPPVAWLDPRNRTEMGFQGSYGKITEPGTPSVKTAIYHAYAERDEYFSPRFYGLAQVAFDHNFSQSLDLQQIYGAGIGWTIMKQPKQTFDLKGTMQYERQSFIDAPPSANENLIGSTFATDYMRKLPKSMVFDQQFAYIPAWNDTHAYSAGETDSLILPVYKRLSMSLGTVDSYLNNPPASVLPIKRNSFQFTFGAAYTLPAPH